MATPRPKTFVAACDFTYKRSTYRRGDPVTNRRHLDHLLKWGSEFVRYAKPAPAEPPADADSAAPQPAESTKED